MRPLEGIRVVDLSTFVAAPSCGRLLAEWGADVIKVEPIKGDVYRVAGIAQKQPNFGDGLGNTAFDNENASKRFIALNLKSEDGKEALYKLIASSDVFLTNMRPKALAKLGFNYEVLSEKYPRLIYADILAYGEKGPDKDRPGFDYTTFYARTGLMIDLPTKGDYPVNVVSGFGDHIAGGILAGAIAAALYKRDRTGEGDRLDAGLLQTGYFILSCPMLSAQHGMEFPRTHYAPNQCLSQNYKCADGEWVFIAATDYDKHFANLVDKVMGHPEMLTDPMCSTRGEMLQHTAEMVDRFDKIFITRTSTEWDERLKEWDVPHEVVRHFKDIPNDEQAWANDYLIKYTYPNGHEAVFSNTPVFFKSSKPVPFKHANRIGGDTAAVLSSIGYTEEELQRMNEEGSIKL